MPLQPKTIVQTFRVDEALDKIIETLRKSENRSKSNMIETLIREALQTRANKLLPGT